MTRSSPFTPCRPAWIATPAARLPPWASVALAITFELFTLAMIRDNLTLNVLMLLWPIARPSIDG